MDKEAIELMKNYRATVFQAIESLVDAGISKDGMEEACSVLDVTSFSDVAEERSLAGLCGYPRCSTGLKEKKWQKYLIRGNKVFDTAERKRFCSDKCYECFVFIVEQLPEEPLWFRGSKHDGERFRLAFLEDEGQKRHGLPGREIELVIESLSQVKLDDDPIEKPSSESSTLDTMAQRSEYAATVSALLKKVERHFGGDESDEHDENDEDEEPIQKHIDCEESALGKWKPSHNKSEPKAAEKDRPRRAIMIDPLPMPPSSKKSGT